MSIERKQCFSQKVKNVSSLTVNTRTFIHFETVIVCMFLVAPRTNSNKQFLSKTTSDQITTNQALKTPMGGFTSFWSRTFV